MSQPHSERCSLIYMHEDSFQKGSVNYTLGLWQSLVRLNHANVIAKPE